MRAPLASHLSAVEVTTQPGKPVTVGVSITRGGTAFAGQLGLKALFSLSHQW